MSSSRTLISSRVNAALSTGLRTGAGKRRPSQNTFRHDCRSRRIVIPENQPRHEFDHLLHEHLSFFQPRNLIERASVGQMTVSQCRMRALRTLETCKMNEAIAAQPPAPNFTRTTAAFQRLASVPGFAILYRYETAQDLNLYRALHPFLDLRRHRETLQNTTAFVSNPAAFRGNLDPYDACNPIAHDRKPVIFQQHKPGQAAPPLTPEDKNCDLHQRSHFIVSLSSRRLHQLILAADKKIDRLSFNGQSGIVVYAGSRGQERAGICMAK